MLYKHPCKGCSPSHTEPSTRGCQLWTPLTAASLTLPFIFINQPYFGVFSPEAHENTQRGCPQGTRPRPWGTLCFLTTHCKASLESWMYTETASPLIQSAPPDKHHGTAKASYGSQAGLGWRSFSHSPPAEAGTPALPPAVALTLGT